MSETKKLPTVTPEQWRSAVLQVLDDRGPDFADPNVRLGMSCVYFDEEGNGSCLFGGVLELLGVTLNDLDMIEGEDVATIMSHLGVDDDPALVFASTEAQASQDSGDTYELVRRFFLTTESAYRCGVAQGRIEPR